MLTGRLDWRICPTLVPSSPFRFPSCFSNSHLSIWSLTLLPLFLLVGFYLLFFYHRHLPKLLGSPHFCPYLRSIVFIPLIYWISSFKKSPSLLSNTVINVVSLTCCSFDSIHCISFSKCLASLSSVKWHFTSSFSSAYFCPFFYRMILKSFICSSLSNHIMLWKNQGSSQKYHWLVIILWKSYLIYLFVIFFVIAWR